jgi:hypothetical protein
MMMVEQPGPRLLAESQPESMKISFCSFLVLTIIIICTDMVSNANIKWNSPLPWMKVEEWSKEIKAEEQHEVVLSHRRRPVDDLISDLSHDSVTLENSS